MKPLKPPEAYFAHWKFMRLAVPLQELARRVGYNLIVHGSLARDIDMVAVPWTEDAISAELFVDLFEETIRNLDTSPAEEIHPTQGPTIKPHGRRAWSIHVQGTYFDLSVMPRANGCDLHA